MMGERGQAFVEDDQIPTLAEALGVFLPQYGFQVVPDDEDEDETDSTEQDGHSG